MSTENQNCDYFNAIKKVVSGDFLECAGYPKCKLAIFDPVEETPCPQCKWPFLTKKTNKEGGGVTLICVNKDCGYKSS